MLKNFCFFQKLSLSALPRDTEQSSYLRKTTETRQESSKWGPKNEKLNILFKVVSDVLIFPFYHPPTKINYTISTFAHTIPFLCYIFLIISTLNAHFHFHKTLLTRPFPKNSLKFWHGPSLLALLILSVLASVICTCLFFLSFLTISL